MEGVARAHLCWVGFAIIKGWGEWGLSGVSALPSPALEDLGKAVPVSMGRTGHEFRAAV